MSRSSSVLALSAQACYGRGRSRRRNRRSRPIGSRPWRRSARLCHHSSSRNSLDTPDWTWSHGSSSHSPNSRVASASIDGAGGGERAPARRPPGTSPSRRRSGRRPAMPRSIHRGPTRRRAPARPPASRCAGRAGTAGSGGSASRGACTPVSPPAAHAPPCPPTGTGVCGLGTKLDDAHVHVKRPPRLTSRPISRARMPRSTMPWTSAWVSRGRPIMKYSLMLRVTGL